MTPTTPTRHARTQRIHDGLVAAERAGLIADGWYAAGNRPGRVWIVTPAGHAERAFTTLEVEAFLLGIEAAVRRPDGPVLAQA